LDQAAIQRPDVRILAPATAPSSPSFPNAYLLNGIAAIAGLLLALLAVMVIEFLERGLRSSDEVELLFGLPVLGMLPHFRPGQIPANATRTAARVAPTAFIEAVRSVGSAIRVNEPFSRGRVITITSVLPREGKTTFAAMLARTLSDEWEDVLIVDCDVRRPSLMAHFPTRSAPGASDLYGRRPLREIALRAPDSRVSILATGDKAGRLFHRGRFEAFIEKAKREYDVVILDCPPLGVVDDALRPARLSDAVVLVVQWGATSQALVQATLRKFKAAKLMPTGIVLSKVHFAWQARYRFAGATYGHFARYIDGRG
jgi:Mrp family chromosome partitioning ATPase